MVHISLKRFLIFRPSCFVMDFLAAENRMDPDESLEMLCERRADIERIVLSTTTKPILWLGCSGLLTRPCYLVQNWVEFQFPIKTSVRNCVRDLGLCESCESCDRQEREMGEN